MSGLRHWLGENFLRGKFSNGSEDETGRVDIEWPALTTADRIHARNSIWCSGFHRGVIDGLGSGNGQQFPGANPVPAKHMKLHCTAALKAIAPTIAPTRLNADQSVTAWAEGYVAGFAAAASGGNTAWHSPAPDYEQGE